MGSRCVVRPEKACKSLPPGAAAAARLALLLASLLLPAWPHFKPTAAIRLELLLASLLLHACSPAQRGIVPPPLPLPAVRRARGSRLGLGPDRVHDSDHCAEVRQDVLGWLPPCLLCLLCPSACMSAQTSLPTLHTLPMRYPPLQPPPARPFCLSQHG